MTKNTFIKVFSAAALVVLLTPMAASAHGLGAGFGGGFFGGWNKADHRSHDDKNNKGNHDDKNKSATTSASAITRASARVIDIADLMGSMSATIGTKITNSNLSADAKADANANLSDYNSSLADAKTKASAAATLAAQIGSSTGTTTNASIVAQARADLFAAWDFIKSAKESLKDILHSLWGAK